MSTAKFPFSPIHYHLISKKVTFYSNKQEIRLNLMLVEVVA